jgi:hypothetical protein
MFYLTDKYCKSLNSWRPVTGRNLTLVLFLLTSLLAAGCTDPDDATVELNVDPELGQAVFLQPEDAANAFTLAVADDDKTMMRQILGEDYRAVLPLDKVDGEDIDNYIRAWEQAHTLLPEGEHKRMLAVGEGKWTLPLPIVQGDTGWYFDIPEGLERMRIRRMGRNELATIQAILAYYDGQMEYAEQDRNADGLLEYARRVISTPGTQDGLYWDTAEGEPQSPLGPLMGDHTPGGGYHGYYYRILEGQGEDARGGAYSYLIGDRMRAGFAAVAWPIEYGESGVMSFMVSHDGIVYESNLGEDTASVAASMTLYNPGAGWSPVQEVNGPQADSR